jgi:membrane protein YqaA with SNARE-associated domain
MTNMPELRVARVISRGKGTDGDASRGFSDLLKTSWVRSSLLVGAVIAAVGLILLGLFRSFDVGQSPFFGDIQAFVADYGLIGIFFATLLAGTVVPLGSPALVVAAALFGAPKIPLIGVATTGFTLGMLVNYGLAYYLGRPYVRKKVSAEKLDNIIHVWGQWGWVLYTIFGLIPVLPVELLAFVCGLLKTRVDVFLVLSFVPRLVVFAMLAYFGDYVGGWIGV